MRGNTRGRREEKEDGEGEKEYRGEAREVEGLKGEGQRRRSSRREQEGRREEKEDGEGEKEYSGEARDVEELKGEGGGRQREE